MSQEPVKIEIENENEEVAETKSEPEPKPVPQITKKKVSELNDQERAQLIADAKNGIENPYFNVKLFKNGGTRITLRKQTKAQELIQGQSVNPEKPITPTTRYLTDNQLLFEHIINLETLCGKLRAKHKKLKKRYNALEGYLYADDKDESDDEEPKPKPELQMKEPEPEPQVQVQPEPEPKSIYQQPFVQRRFVRSWRDLRPQ